jgi:hypothetical protein
MVTVTRAEHLEWCKRRAKAYIEEGKFSDAIASMCSDLKKHRETEDHVGIELGMLMAMGGHLSTRESIIKFIDGFN